MNVRTALSSSIVLAFAALVVCAAKASAAPCPVLGSISSHDGHAYVARGFAAAPYSGAVNAVFFTGTAEYDAQIPSLSVTTADKRWGFRSEKLAFLNPATEPLEAVVITFPQTEATDRCIEHQRIDPPSEQDDAPVKAVFEGLKTGTVPIALTKGSASSVALSCPKPYADARIDGHPVQPQYPAIARAMGETGTARVRVALNADGSVASTNLYISSGFPSLDQSTLQAAQATRYYPEIFRCEPITGAYVFTAEFTGH